MLFDLERCLRGEDAPNVPPLRKDWDLGPIDEQRKHGVLVHGGLAWYQGLCRRYPYPVALPYGRFPLQAFGLRFVWRRRLRLTDLRPRRGIHPIWRQENVQEKGLRVRFLSQSQSTWFRGPKLLCPKPRALVASDIEKSILRTHQHAPSVQAYHFEVLDLNITSAGQEAEWKGLPSLHYKVGYSPLSLVVDKEKKGIIYFAFLVHDCHVYCFNVSTELWIMDVVAGGSPASGLVDINLAAAISRLALDSLVVTRDSEGCLGELAEIFDQYNKLDDGYPPLGFVL
ncbi:hypothetical protein Dimus_007351 [Dionaea muscipula]